MSNKIKKRIGNELAPACVVKARRQPGYIARLKSNGIEYRSEVVETIEQAMIEHDKIILRNNLNKKTFKEWKKL
jgi:hypothetical protein